VPLGLLARWGSALEGRRASFPLGWSSFYSLLGFAKLSVDETPRPPVEESHGIDI